MHRLFNRRSVLVAALAAFAVFGAAFAACGGDDTSKATENNSAMAAITYLENSGFHEIDTAITTDGKVPSTAHNTAVHMQTVLLTATWPSELKDQAKTVAKALGDFAAAVDTDTPDIARVKDLSNKAHAGYHDFTTKAWAHLGAEAGLTTAAGHTDHAAASATAMH